MRSISPHTRISCLVIFFFLYFVYDAVSQNTPNSQVYKCQDETGKTFFCNDPSRSPSNLKAELPQIGRENIDNKIAEIKSSKLETCKKHGGDKCELGADSDGSIICADGYRDSALPFKSVCLEAKLQVVSLALLRGGVTYLEKGDSNLSNGELLDSDMLQLSLRNLTAVPAKLIKVYFETQRIAAKLADGPEAIEAYGSAEYQLRAASFSKKIPLASEVRYKISCVNCADITGYAFRK